MEGRLTPDQEAELEAFLLAHPDLDPGDGTAPVVQADPVQFPGKERLHRHFPPLGMPDAVRLDDFLVARMEGELSATQERALQRLLEEDPEAARQAALMARAKVQAGAPVFPHKDRLKKREARVVPLWTRMAVAASVLLLLAAGAWWLRNGRGEAQQLARAERPKPAQPKPEQQPQAPAVLPSAPQASTPVPEKTSTVHRPSGPTTVARKGKPSNTVDSVRAPAPSVEPKPAPAMEPAPQLAQKPGKPASPEQVPTPEQALASAQPEEAAAPSTAAVKGQDIATFMANVVRKEVLTSPARTATLDGNDALALADKAVSAVTGGHGSVQEERTAGRKRFNLRLGRNFSISASSAR
jgi:hypothetical protein